MPVLHQNICKQQPLLSTEWIKFYSPWDNFRKIFQKRMLSDSIKYSLPALLTVQITSLNTINKIKYIFFPSGKKKKKKKELQQLGSVSWKNISLENPHFYLPLITTQGLQGWEIIHTESQPEYQQEVRCLLYLSMNMQMQFFCLINLCLLSFLFWGLCPFVEATNKWKARLKSSTNMPSNVPLICLPKENYLCS